MMSHMMVTHITKCDKDISHVTDTVTSYNTENIVEDSGIDVMQHSNNMLVL